MVHAMNKGFASILALGIVALALHSALAQNTVTQTIDETIQATLEAENANFLRTELELNTDRIIQFELASQLQNGQFDPVQINDQLAQTLFEFFENIQTQNESVSFFWTHATRENYNRLLEQPRYPLSVFQIKETMQTIVITHGNLHTAETVFTGGASQNTVIAAEIKLPHQTDFFLIPIGYTVHATVIQ